MPEEELAAFTPEQRASLVEYGRLATLLKEIVATVDVSEPWKTPNAAELDSMTFQSWWVGSEVALARRPGCRARLEAWGRLVCTASAAVSRAPLELHAAGQLCPGSIAVAAPLSSRPAAHPSARSSTSNCPCAWRAVLPAVHAAWRAVPPAMCAVCRTPPDPIPPCCRLQENSNDKFARDLLSAIEPLAGGALGGIRPGWVSVLHIARQMKAAPQSEEPERYLFWGAAGQFVDHLAKVCGRWVGGWVGGWEVLTRLASQGDDSFCK